MIAHRHAHGNGGHDPGREASCRRLAWNLALVVAYVVAEVVGGLVSGSLALLADAGHMLSDIHDLHLWTITSGFEACSAHVEVGERDRDTVLGDVQAVLSERFRLDHATIQVEAEGCCPPGRCD